MAHALHGNVVESQHEITNEVKRLIGAEASKAAAARIGQLMRLQQTINAVRKMSGKMSPDRYLKVLDRLEQMLKEIEQ